MRQNECVHRPCDDCPLLNYAGGCWDLDEDGIDGRFEKWAEEEKVAIREEIEKAGSDMEEISQRIARLVWYQEYEDVKNDKE